MPVIDDLSAWILRLFEMEEREGRGADCDRFPNGVRPAKLPLTPDERVYGTYKGKYHFTPLSLMISAGSKVERIDWAAVSSCSSKHGEGKTFSTVTLTDGRTVRVRVGDMATGWSGRISQLFHQMIERHAGEAFFGKPLLSSADFFARATDDYCIAPNLEPHPSLAEFRDALRLIEEVTGATAYFDLLDDEELACDAIVIVAPEEHDDFRRFADRFGADGIIEADPNTTKKLGAAARNKKVFRITWD
jgi:hypothetical protein